LESRIRWNDYSDIDLILSVRDIPHAHALLKPANKLTNAWMAGVPALIGPEPAIEVITESHLDYIPVREPVDVFRALDILERNPDLYSSMVEHGHKRGLEFNEAAVATRWIETLEIAKTEYISWSNKAPAGKLADFEKRLQRHSVHMRRHLTEVHAAYEQLGYGKRWWEMRDSEQNGTRKA
jgi:hypothetical protein